MDIINLNTFKASLKEYVEKITHQHRPMALPDLWLKLYWMIHFAFLAFAEGLAVPRY
jgi:hypothetical protein